MHADDADRMICPFKKTEDGKNEKCCSTMCPMWVEQSPWIKDHGECAFHAMAVALVEIKERL